MKYRDITTLQSGGRVYFSAVADPSAQTTSSTTTTASDDDDELIDKTLLKDLAEKAMPNDFRKFMTELSDIQTRVDAGFKVSKSQLYGLQAYANQIIQQSAYMETAEKEALKQGSWDEAAVTNDGYMYVQNHQGRIEKVAMNKFDIKKHRSLSIGELIQARREDNSLIDRQDIVTTVGNAIGTEKINDYLKTIIDTIGTSKSTVEAYKDLTSILGGSAQKPTQAEFNTIVGLMDQIDKVGLDTVFKSTEYSSSKNVKEALNYIYKMLPKNMQMQLSANYVANGNDYKKTNDYISSVVVDALRMSNDVEYQSKIEFDSEFNKQTKPSTAGQFNQTTNEMLFDGDLNQISIPLTWGDNESYSIELKGSVAPALTTDKNVPVSNLPMLTALNMTIGNRVDSSHMYMGKQKLQGQGDLLKLAYGNDRVAQVYMPTLSNGDIDWEGFQKYVEAEEEIKAQGITDIETKNHIHAVKGSFAQYDESGKLIHDPNRPCEAYLLTYGYTIDDNVDSDNTMVSELTGAKEDAAELLLKQIYSKEMGKKTGIKDMPHRQYHDDIIKVPVFLKVNQYASMDSYRYGGHGSRMDPRTLQQDMVQQQVQAAPEMPIYSSSALLYQE